MARPYETMQVGKRVESEGLVWTIDAKAFYNDDGSGELRIYRVNGDITSPHLRPALEAEAALCGLALSIKGWSGRTLPPR